jgi:Flp pilus assembly protein TadG
MKIIFSALKSRKGQSIVEISLITPLLLIALYVPADFGIAFFVMNIASTAARDGAALGSVIVKTGGTATDPDFTSDEADTVKNAVVGRLPAFLTGRSVTVKFYEDTPGNCFEFIEVQVSGSYNFFFYQLLRLFGSPVTNPVTLSRTTQMPYRYQPSTNSTKCTGGPAPFVYGGV